MEDDVQKLTDGHQAVDEALENQRTRDHARLMSPDRVRPHEPPREKSPTAAPDPEEGLARGHHHGRQRPLGEAARAAAPGRSATERGSRRCAARSRPAPNSGSAG